MSEDRQLAAGLKRGESAALRRIYLKYKDDLLNVARSLVGDLNTAEDCLHDVFVALASERCRIRSNLKGYLVTGPGIICADGPPEMLCTFICKASPALGRMGRPTRRRTSESTSSCEPWRRCPRSSGKSSPCTCRAT